MRAVQRKLAARDTAGTETIRGDTTVGELAEIWLEHRRQHGKSRSEGPLAPQTLAGYDNEVRVAVVPALGGVHLREITVPLLDNLFAAIENGRPHGRYPARPGGRATEQLRVVLSGMFSLAVRHGAMTANPMRDTPRTSRRRPREVDFLTVEAALHLRRRVRREAVRIPDRRMPNHDLQDLVDLLLATGCREGEALALRRRDLDLDADVPTAAITGTLVNPRTGYVEALHRQDWTKNHEDRTLVLPDAAVQLLRRRLADSPADDDTPVFRGRTGGWLHTSNLRTRLRTALARVDEPPSALDLAVAGTTFHTLRRTVGTLLAHEVSLDAARDQLGHRDPSVTFRHYVGRREVAPDLRAVLDRLLAPLDI
ncbi:tyrosine-type recombinase/integrase [Nocardioides sp. GY 10127]|uniref:site-specific integrase n=1 Tax=Nocardioides sp. GY 10127 TaxID=2569762 RepID=UPI0010A8FEEA|nr:tyrosine-type recombinase/integrase [Nocardioides sp. GY 10127]TIC79261.1 hypothetical protein E8D37_16760 [Nocardioides sp. GY 10127]